IDGRLSGSQDVTVEPGSSRFILPVEPLTNGHHVLRLQLQGDEDTQVQNNSAGAYVIVQGPPRALVVEGTPGDGRFLDDACPARVGLIICTHVSGAVGVGPRGASKMDLSKEAALAAGELLGEYDQVGILAFDDHNQWMIPPTFASDLTPIEDAISRMQPGGGTEIYPALKEANDALAPLDAKVKHIILLTDGEAPRGPYEDLAKQMDAAQVSLSTV